MMKYILIKSARKRPKTDWIKLLQVCEKFKMEKLIVDV